jgi:sulfur oxidation c-type cytochrome SoxX
MTWTDRVAETSANGGNCYNCHQIDKKEISFGTIGPSLYNYGKLRGVKDPPARRQAIIEYTWGKIWNAKAYNACSNMPRAGHNGRAERRTDGHLMAAHDRLPRAAEADLLPRAQRQPGHRRPCGQGAAPGRRASAEGLRHQAGHAEAHAFTYLDFEKAAQTYGKVGGFAHLATLVKRCAPAARARCCSTAATPGRARPPRCGPRARTWSTPASCSAWTS